MASRKDSKGRVLKKGEYERPDGRYQYAYTTITGKRTFIYAKTIEELRKKEREYQIASYSGASNYGTKVSINSMFDRAISLKVGIKESTYVSYMDRYNKHVREDFGKLPISRVTHSDILAFYNSLLRNKGLSVGTIAVVHLQLLSSFQLAYKDGIIAKNPLDGVFSSFRRNLAKTERKVHALTIEEQRAFLDYLDNHPRWGRYHSIFQIMLGTGLRVGELCGLRWQDVDIEKRVIDINHTLCSVNSVTGISKGKLTISTPKTKAGTRRIPIMKSVADAFIEEYKIAESKGFISETIDGYSGFVFTSKNGTVYNTCKLNIMLDRIVESYNKQENMLAKEEKRIPFLLPHISNHMLRHTFCTRLCERDVNIKVIQTLMGHSNINITLNIYAEVSEAKQFEEIDRLADELNVF